MRALLKPIGVVLGSILAVLALTWLFQGNDFFMYKYFGVKYENARRGIFEQSRAFNQGMVQELENMQFQYVKMDPVKQKEERDAMASIILHRASGYNLDDPIVPSSLRRFIDKLRDEYGEDVGNENETSKY